MGTWLREQVQLDEAVTGILDVMLQSCRLTLGFRSVSFGASRPRVSGLTQFPNTHPLDFLGSYSYIVVYRKG